MIISFKINGELKTISTELTTTWAEVKSQIEKMSMNPDTGISDFPAGFTTLFYNGRRMLDDALVSTQKPNSDDVILIQPVVSRVKGIQLAVEAAVEAAAQSSAASPASPPSQPIKANQLLNQAETDLEMKVNELNEKLKAASTALAVALRAAARYDALKAVPIDSNLTDIEKAKAASLVTQAGLDAYNTELDYALIASQIRPLEKEILALRSSVQKEVSREVSRKDSLEIRAITKYLEELHTANQNIPATTARRKPPKPKHGFGEPNTDSQKAAARSSQREVATEQKHGMADNTAFKKVYDLLDELEKLKNQPSANKLAYKETLKNLSDAFNNLPGDKKSFENRITEVNKTIKNFLATDLTYTPKGNSGQYGSQMGGGAGKDDTAASQAAIRGAARAMMSTAKGETTHHQAEVVNQLQTLLDRLTAVLNKIEVLPQEFHKTEIDDLNLIKNQLNVSISQAQESLQGAKDITPNILKYYNLGIENAEKDNRILISNTATQATGGGGGGGSKEAVQAPAQLDPALNTWLIKLGNYADEKFNEVTTSATATSNKKAPSDKKAPGNKLAAITLVMAAAIYDRENTAQPPAEQFDVWCQANNLKELSFADRLSYIGGQKPTDKEIAGFAILIQIGALGEALQKRLGETTRFQFIKPATLEKALFEGSEKLTGILNQIPDSAPYSIKALFAKNGIKPAQTAGAPAPRSSP